MGLSPGAGKYIWLRPRRGYYKRGKGSPATPGFPGRYSGAAEGQSRKKRNRKIMQRNTWFFKRISGVMLVFGLLMVVACSSPTGGDEDGDGNGNGNSINWNTEANGTLTVINNTSKDMVIFQGQTPSASNILGGVRATSQKEIDVSDDVSDFDVGGYMILRGISKNEYEANKTNLSLAKIEYSAMATYKAGKKYRAEISPNYTGDFGYKVTNSGRIGLELRKNSPDGEKIAYLPSLATNVTLYSETSSSLSIFPVYVYYTKSTGTVTTLKPTSHFDSVTATPRPLANASTIQSYYFPNDTTVTWDQIKSSLKSPVAYFTVSNNVPNQGVFFTLAGGNALFAQNGYDAVGTGEQLTFELESTVLGTEKNVVITLYNGSLKLPARFANESTNPVIKNGYDYTVNINFNGGSVSDAANYTVTLVEGSERDLSNEIESL
jgi:hypothetical protein